MIKLTAFEQRTIRAAKKLAEELKLRGFIVKYIDFEYALYRCFGDYEIIISSILNRNRYWIELWEVSSNSFRSVEHRSDIPKSDILTVVKQYRKYIKDNTREELAA